MSIPISMKVGRMYSLGKAIRAAIGAKRKRAIPRAIPTMMGLSFIIMSLEIGSLHLDGVFRSLIDKLKILLGIDEFPKIVVKSQQILFFFEIEIKFQGLFIRSAKTKNVVLLSQKHHRIA